MQGFIYTLFLDKFKHQWQYRMQGQCIWAWRPEKEARQIDFVDDKPVYSAGMWGGRRKEVDGMLQCVTGG